LAYKYADFVLNRILQMELQRHFVKRFFEEDMFFRLLEEGRVTDPASRFTMWDYRALIDWYFHIVSAGVGAIIGNLSLLGLLEKDARDEVLPVLTVIFSYMILSCFVYIKAFTPTYDAYGSWILHSTQLHANLVHVHGNAEAVALMRGSETERRRAHLMLDRCIQAGSKYIWLKDYAMPVASDLFFDRIIRLGLASLVAPLVLRGDIGARMAVFVVGVAWKTVREAHNLSQVFVGNPGGYTGMLRVWQMSREMDRIRDASAKHFTDWGERADGILLEQDDAQDCVLELRDLTLHTPSMAGGRIVRTLFQDVTLTLPPGESLVIVGASGIGKTSLLRAVAGLWRGGSGSVRRASDPRSYFVAQRPYVCVGTLREQVLYPDIARTDVDDERLEAALRAVQLEHLLQNPGLAQVKTYDRWWSKLSLGEAQRISFARLLLQDELRLAFLDEATSALSPKAEKAMYSLISGHIPSFVSVAHRPEAWRFHNRVLALARTSDGQGPTSWRELTLEVTLEEHERELTGVPRATS